MQCRQHGRIVLSLPLIRNMLSIYGGMEKRKDDLCRTCRNTLKGDLRYRITLDIQISTTSANQLFACVWIIWDFSSLLRGNGLLNTQDYDNQQRLNLIYNRLISNIKACSGRIQVL